MIDTDLYLELGRYLLSSDFQQRLLEKGLEKQVAHVDLFKAQPATNQAYDLPAVFIELKNSQSSSEDEEVISEQLNLAFHIEQRDLGSTAMNSSSQKPSLEILRLTKQVKQWLLLWRSENHHITRLVYVGSSPDKRGKNNPTHILHFACVHHWERACNE